MESPLKIKIKIGQVEFEAEGDANEVTKQRDVFIQSVVPAASSFLDKIQSIETTRAVETSANSLVVQNDASVPVLPNSSRKEECVDWSRTNIINFLSKYGDLSDRDFVLFAAYYHEQKNQSEKYVFTVDDVKKYYGEARRPVYSNNSQLLKMLVKAGYIIDDPDAENTTPKPYIISQEGLHYIESYTPKEKTEKKTKKASVPRKKIESSYASLNADDLNLSKYPSISSLNSSKEQIMMAMYIITMEGRGEWFKNSDIEYIMPNIFDIHVTKDMVSNAFRQKSWFNTKKAEDEPKSLTHRLLSQAKEFAKKIIDEQSKDVE